MFYNLKFFEVNDIKELPKEPTLWIELRWVLGDGHDSKQGKIAGFENEKDLLEQYHLWSKLTESIHDYHAVKAIADRYNMDYDDFIYDHIPHDERSGNPYDLKRVIVKQRQGNQVVSYRLKE